MTGPTNGLQTSCRRRQNCIPYLYSGDERACFIGGFPVSETSFVFEFDPLQTLVNLREVPKSMVHLSWGALYRSPYPPCNSKIVVFLRLFSGMSME